MNKLTIQINNLEALERLIGGDNEIEIEIRNSIVQKFAEKHLKSVANSNSVSQTLQRIQEEIRTVVSDKCEKEIATFKTYYAGSSPYEIKLKPHITEEIDRQIKSLVDREISRSVEVSVKKWSGDMTIEERISKRFDYYGTDLINAKIKERIDKLKASI